MPLAAVPTSEEHASSDQRDEQRDRMGASAGTEGLHHVGTVEEGDRKGGNDNPPCGDQGHEPTAVVQTSDFIS